MAPSNVCIIVFIYIDILGFKVGVGTQGLSLSQSWRKRDSCSDQYCIPSVPWFNTTHAEEQRIVHDMSANVSLFT